MCSEAMHLPRGFFAARRALRILLTTLDTLFLTMPISWKGTLAPYVGRLHREHHAKQEVVVFDYVDSGVPMFLRMALKRQSGYRSLRYSLDTAPASVPVA